MFFGVVSNMGQSVKSFTRSAVLLLLVVTPSLAAEFTYKEYSASSEAWKQGFVFAISNYLTSVVSPHEAPSYSTTHAYRRCLGGASDVLIVRQVEAYVARNPISFTEPMVSDVLRALHDLCRSEIEKGAKGNSP
jgi:hypothetical protein